MHELGILVQIAKSVKKIMAQQHIDKIRHITLEIGEASGVVPRYMHKLFPVAADMYPFLQDVEMKLQIVPGKGLIIKDIGY